MAAMNLGTLIKLAGLVLSLSLAIQGAVLAYVVRMESRMTRLETIIELRLIAKPVQPLERMPLAQPAPRKVET